MIPGFGAGLVIPDLWQQEAVRALQQGKDVVVQAPTGSGKTYIFELLYPNLKTQAVFTVPTRALALQFASLSLNNGKRSACPTIQWLQPSIVSGL
jgi:superfamily II DNA/RNA helicase